MKLLSFLKESNHLASILVLNLISLLPWLAVFWHSSAGIGWDDGPNAMFVLISTAVGTLFVLPFYSVASILILSFQSKLVLRFICALFLLVVLAFCVGSSYLWGNVGMDGGALFNVVALLYAAFSLKIVKELILVICQKSALKVNV